MSNCLTSKKGVALLRFDGYGHAPDQVAAPCFVASGLAGLFCLPRIFVNLAIVSADSVAKRERLLLTTARKLLRFTTNMAFPVVIPGVWLKPF